MKRALTLLEEFGTVFWFLMPFTPEVSKIRADAYKQSLDAKYADTPDLFRSRDGIMRRAVHCMDRLQTETNYSVAFSPSWRNDPENCHGFQDDWDAPRQLVVTERGKACIPENAIIRSTDLAWFVDQVEYLLKETAHA